MIRRITVASTPLAVLVLSVALYAQQDSRPGWDDHPEPSPGRDGIVTLHTGVQLVVQDITVTDANGKPITGLKPEDFHIFEDGRPQTVKSFEEHAPIDPALAEERAAALAHQLPPNTFTNYKAFASDNVVVFLFDAMDGGSGLRPAMIDYMKSAPLGTPYVILKLDTSLHLSMEQDMTTDLNTLRAAVLGKWDTDYVGFGPQLGSDDPRYATWPAAMSRRQIITALMAQLKQYLGAIPGRKTLVWIGNPGGMKMMDPDTMGSAGTQASIDPDHPTVLVYSDPHATPGLFDPKALPAPAEMKKNPSLQNFLGDMTDSLAQSHIALYRLGCQAHPAADVPGGTYPVCDYPDAKDQITAIVDQSSHFYTITYTPTNQNLNGQPRRFSVKMDDPSLRLQYRHSYLGGPNDTAVQHVQPQAQNAASAAVLEGVTGPSLSLQTAMGMGMIEPTQVIFQASATPAPAESKDPDKQPAAPGNFLSAKLRKQGYRVYTIHYRVRANELKLTPNPDRTSYAAKLDFVVVVYDNQGHAVNGKREKASVTFDNLTDPQLQTAELTGDLAVEVPTKGSYFLRLGVRDTTADRAGALELPVGRIALPKM